MCTLTYTPLSSDHCILTSNRDEQHSRSSSLLPNFRRWNTEDILFPKDPDAGGSWIAGSKKGRLVCLLNGGVENHIPKEHYSKSRGIILLSVAVCEDITEFFKEEDLTSIQPFTLISIEKKESILLEERIWTGEVFIHRVLDAEKPYIWSSSTIYPPEIRALREEWFEAYLKEPDAKLPDSLFRYHLEGGKENPKWAMCIHNSYGGTVSVTQIQWSFEEHIWKYYSLRDQNKSFHHYFV